MTIDAAIAVRGVGDHQGDVGVHFLDVVRVNRGRGRGQPTFEQVGCVIERDARIDELLGEVNQVLVWACSAANAVLLWGPLRALLARPVLWARCGPLGPYSELAAPVKGGVGVFKSDTVVCVGRASGIA